MSSFLIELFSLCRSYWTTRKNACTGCGKVFRTLWNDLGRMTYINGLRNCLKRALSCQRFGGEEGILEGRSPQTLPFNQSLRALHKLRTLHPHHVELCTVYLCYHSGSNSYHARSTKETVVSIVARMRSFTAQLLASHLLVAILTSISLLLLIFLVAAIRPERLTLDQLRGETEHTLADWQRGAAAEGVDSRPMPGRGASVVIVTADEIVRYRRGVTPCQVGMALADCAAALRGRPAGERYLAIDGQRTAEVVLPLIDGARDWPRPADLV
jgi:hypothetical protein